jgi:2-(1,2-epoxy-1,2-dihydrophenyl)acetyl-CoA isomerase
MEQMALAYHGKVAVLKFNHPEAMNAVGKQMMLEFVEALDEVRNPASGARCLLLTGEGRGFCAGADLNDDHPQRDPIASNRLRIDQHPVLFRLRDLEIPLVTAVNGAAAGVGMSYAMFGDIVCASKSAFFLQAFARVGLVPDGGASYMLPRMIGWGRALELAMLAERLSAEQAHEWGLVNRLYDDADALMEGAMAIAQQLANGPKSLHLIRQAYWQTWESAFEQQLELEARLQGAAEATSDHKEGLAAFREKRDPNFQGR